MKEGGVKKTKKQPTTKTQTKPPVLIKHRVDSNPEKGEKAPDLMREGVGQEQNSPQCFLQHSCQAIPQEFLHPAFGSKKLIRCCAKQGPLFLPPHCFPNKPRVGAPRSWLWVPGDGMVPPQQGWREFFFEIWFTLNKDNDPSRLKMSCPEMIINIFTFQTLSSKKLHSTPASKSDCALLRGCD